MTDLDDATEFADRLAAFSRDRLAGRPVPADLRAMLIADWRGIDLGLGLAFPEPGAPHPLRDHDYLGPQERADPVMQCELVAWDRMTEFVHLVAEEDGADWFGYWTHPDESGDLLPIAWDTEAQFWDLDGATLAEALAARQAEFDDDPPRRFAELVDALTTLGVPMGTRVLSELRSMESVVDGNELQGLFAEEERRRRGLA